MLIPALCGSRDESLIRQALNEASQADLEKWDEENIPYTMRRKRQKFFESESQKTENKLTDKISSSTGYNDPLRLKQELELKKQGRKNNTLISFEQCATQYIDTYKAG